MTQTNMFVRSLAALRRAFASFRVRVTLVLVGLLLGLMAASDLMIYQFAMENHFQQLRRQMQVLASTAALMIDAETFQQIPLNKGGVSSAAYQAVLRQLQALKAAHPSIKYVYTMRKTADPKVLQFVVDPQPVLRHGKRTIATAFPGDSYDASRFPDMLQAFEAPTADQFLAVDEWGAALSGYAPIRARTGAVVGILGMDMAAEQVYQLQQRLHKRIIAIVLVSLGVAVVLGIFISGRITDRIEQLVEGTRHLAADELDYTVQLKGHDEISELAGSFNKMAQSLCESRRRMNDYFYRAVQSLVRILEAKDQYTKGHSERVAEIAARMGDRLGLGATRVQMLKKTAELHDIGKLVIPETILNKPGKLTEEEWQIIRDHPVIGEEVLQPVLIDEELLDVVRGHHERYDGTGYPDRLKGEAIRLFSQIIAVADAYDAMTSPRAYRPAMTHDVAVVELKTHAGSQFSPRMVEVFLALFDRRS